MPVPLAIVLVLAGAALAAAAEPRTIRLWEGDAPGALGAADHDVPVLTWWAAERADLGVLCYPVASMATEWTHGGSRRNLLGDAPAAEVVADLSAEAMPAERIAGMPPVFIFHTHEDSVVKLGPILQLALRMKQAGRPYALHVYEKGPHGLGLGTKPYDPAKLHPWAGECGRWLAAHGYTTAPADPQAPH